MIPTCVLGGWLGGWLGCRVALMLVAPLFSLGFALQAAAWDFTILIFGRILCGVAGGMACGPTAVGKPININTTLKF